MSISEAAACIPYWKCGLDNIASDIRAVLGSVVHHAVMSDGNTLAVSRIVFKESSHSIVGPNITSREEVFNNSEHCLVMPEAGGDHHRLSVVMYDMHQRLQLAWFC